MLSYTPTICITYLVIYFITVTPIFLLITYSNIKTTTQINTNQKTKSTYLILLVLICSLAGIPPLTGFIPKLLAIYTLIPTHYITLLLILIGSFINLYFYLNVAFRANIQPLFLKRNKSQKMPTTALIIISTSTLGALPILICAMTYIY
jgi:NADH:ubiquinone oxidoreductase subunit 2 (subunit N)